MSFSEEKRESIKRYMLEKIREDDERYLIKTAENFQISVTSVKRYFTGCLEQGILKADPQAKTGFCLDTEEKEFQYPHTDFLTEDQIFYTDICPCLEGISEQAHRIWSYAFMEIMNNAIEHAEADKICCRLKRDCLYTEISVWDNGIGIFQKIQRYLSGRLGRPADRQDAVLELYKGKFTTDREQHSGEGIFFTSKMLQEFVIWSDGSAFVADCAGRREFLSSRMLSYYMKGNQMGTLAIMRLENDSRRNIREIFDRYAPLEEGFVNTVIPIREACPYGEPIARSQARKIVYRLEEFKRVTLDFSGVDFMGQGFADEIFRVFQKKHPETELIPVNANEMVLGMIGHVLADNR